MSKEIGLIGGGLDGGPSGKELIDQLHVKGYRVALVTGKNGELGIDTADYVLTTDLRNIATIRSFFNDLGVKYLILATGHILAFKLAEELEKGGIVPNVNIKASLIAKDKSDYKAMVEKNGFLTPAYFTVSSEGEIPDIKTIEEKIGLPCVVKATIDTMNPQKVNTWEELRAAIEEVWDSGSPVLVEQLIKGITITVPVSVANGIAKAYAVCYYSKAEARNLKGFTHEDYIKERLSKETESKVLDYCERLAIASGFEGLPRIDIMAFPDGDIYVLEANSVGRIAIDNARITSRQYDDAMIRPLLKKGINLVEVTVEAALKKFGLAQ